MNPAEIASVNCSAEVCCHRERVNYAQNAGHNEQATRFGGRKLAGKIGVPMGHTGVQVGLALRWMNARSSY